MTAAEARAQENASAEKQRTDMSLVNRMIEWGENQVKD
jgi:hypothetical protein